MKKYLLLLITFLASFIICSNVKAESIGTVQISKEYFDNYFHSIYDLDISSTSTLSIEEIIESFKTKLNYNSETEDYFIYYVGVSAIYMFTWEKGTNFSYPIGYFFNKNSSGKLVSHIYGYSDTKMKYISYHYSSNTYNPVSYGNVINGNNILFINSGTISNGIYDGTGALKHQYFSSSVDIIVSDYNNYNGYYDLLIDDGIICHSLNTGSILFNADGSLNIESSYDYEGIIETYDKSKIEIDFDIPENETFSFDLDLLTQFSDIYLSKPYLEYTDIYDNITISQIDDFLGERTEVGATDTEGNELYQYEGNFGIDFNELKQLKIIFDVSNYTYDLYLKFTSSLNYNINYIYSIDDNDYYKTIFMNDKYGIYLIPKTKNSDNFSTINLSGKYNIEIRNNYIDSENYDVLEKYTDYIEPNFQYKYTFNNLNYLIYFENVNYNTEEDDSYYLTFDTRQFNYAIKNMIYDSPTIINPNTDQEINIDSNDSINRDNSINDYISSVQKFLSEMKEFIMIPVDLFTYFFNQLNSYIRMTIITIFIVLVVIGFILIFRR